MQKPPDPFDAKVLMAGFNIGTGILRKLAESTPETEAGATMLRDWLKSTLTAEELVVIVDQMGFLFGGDFAEVYFEMEAKREAQAAKAKRRARKTSSLN
jgi:hypothetical protein